MAEETCLISVIAELDRIGKIFEELGLTLVDSGGNSCGYTRLAMAVSTTFPFAQRESFLRAAIAETLKNNPRIKKYTSVGLKNEGGMQTVSLFVPNEDLDFNPRPRGSTPLNEDRLHAILKEEGFDHQKRSGWASGHVRLAMAVNQSSSFAECEEAFRKAMRLHRQIGPHRPVYSFLTTRTEGPDDIIAVYVPREKAESVPTEVEVREMVFADVLQEEGLELEHGGYPCLGYIRLAVAISKEKSLKERMELFRNTIKHTKKVNPRLKTYICLRVTDSDDGNSELISFYVLSKDNDNISCADLIVNEGEAALPQKVEVE